MALALSEQAEMKTGNDANDLLATACDKFAQAIRIEPEQYEAWYNWGNAIYEEAKAKVKSGGEANDLFAEAYEKYARAAQIKPSELGPSSQLGTGAR